MINENKDFFINDVEVEELTLEEKKPSTSKVLYEDTSKRGANIKHFRLQNGNFMAVMYDHPIHKLNPDTGKFVDISSEVTETDTDYEAIMPCFKVRLPKTEGKEHFVTVEKDNREISWKFIPRSTSRRKKSMAAFANKMKRDPWDIGDHPSVKYERADTNVDLEYDVSDDGVKESIVLTKNPNCKIFTFQMKFKGLLPVLSEDKKVVSLVRDDDDLGSEMPEMKIPPAYMEDANDAFCDDIHYEIRKMDEGTFLDLVLDSDWLSDPERAYPVVIDPRVEISWYSGNSLQMVELCSNGNKVSASDTNAGRRVGVDSCGNIHRLYIGFSLPTLADGFKITKAGLIIHQKAYASYNGSIEDYTIAPVVDPDGKTLSVDSFKWENVQNLTMETAIDTLRGEHRLAERELEIDMTAAMERWYDPTKTFVKEKCIVIKKNNEDPCCCNGNCVSTYIDLYSLYANYKYHPKMYIEYTSTDMYSDHQKFHTFENGRAGTGSINLFTGKMSFAHGDVTAEGVKLPLSISHLYRHEYVNEDANSVNRYGKGWKLSVEQTLEVIGKHGIKAVYTNAQGKRHYFTYNDTNANGEITDDAGLGLTYKEECNCVCGHATTHILTDEKGNKMTFNSAGKLIQLIDTNGNVSCLNYTNGRLSSVVDGTNHSAQLYYDNSGMLTKIVDNGDMDRAILYDYNSSGELTSITYPSADTAYSNEGTLQTQFVYGANSRLEQVIDYTGIKHTIGYDTNGRVETLSISGNTIVVDNSVTTSNEIKDDSISFEYRAKSTAIVNDRTKIKTVYKFDANGRELSSYQDMTDITDSSKISESTITEISGYESIVDNLETSRIGKYRSLSVSMSNDSADETNFIQNGFFTEVNSSSKPIGWSAVGSGSVISQSYINGKKSYRFTSSGYSKYLSQTIDLCNCQLNGNVLVASAWAKASGNVTAESDNSSAKFRLCLKVTYEGGEAEEHFENYDVGYTGWQYAAIPFVLNKECCPISITVKLDYTGNTGTCYFTNARLVSVDGISTTNAYRTDETPIDSINVFGECKDIKMTTTKKDSVLTTIDYTDDDSDIVRTTVIDRYGRSYTTDYKYDSKHNLIKTQDYRGLVIEYTYNAYGKELTRKTYHKDTPGTYMFSEHSYQDGTFVKSESDPRYTLNGEKLETTYQHDTSRNLLLKQTAVNGQEYNYSYDDTTDDLMSLSSTVENKTNENQFFYTRGYLTRVAHNGFNFGFSFDQLGRSKTVTVGDNAATTTLLSMSYSKTGINDVNDVITTEYASNEKNTVTTDILGNPIVSKYTDTNNVERIISNATYDSVGKVKQLIDNERGVCYNYTYDAKGNVTKIVETDINGNILATNTFVFDANERLTSKTYG
ncbi:MAG: RHS repeat protein, partial [Clostridia bacterium]|nr:RHS repeat protein [Clostridia bacterium]